jgi:polar amino acid transport system substrate-binding protein
MEKLYVTQPYYSTPANFFVKPDSPFRAPADLAGKEIGVCSGCTHQSYLEGTLDLPGVELKFAVADPKIITYNTEPPGLRDTADGKLDAFLCSETVGLGLIADGVALRELEEPAYYTYKTGYADRDVALAMGPFLAAVDAAIDDLHASGRLEALSVQFFGKDYATPAASFDVGALDQQVR